MTDTEPYPVREWEAHVYDFLNAPIPDEILDHGTRVVADVLCAVVAGSADTAIASVGTTASFEDGPSTILGTAKRTSAPQAALVNGAAAIAQEAEEGHNTGGHVGAGIVVGGVAAAEMADTDGETLVDACIRSYEVCVRLERAIFAMKDRLNEATPWLLRDPHSTWTTVGPALTAAQVLGASQQQLRETFRISANLAVVSMYDPYAEGPPARNFTAGFSAQAGVSAALSAMAGLDGSESAIKIVYDPFKDGFSEKFSTSFSSLGDEWEIRRNYFKPYPSCRYTHPPLDALQEALASSDSNVAATDVESVTVRTFGNAVDMDHPDPKTPTSAKFSTPYVIARYFVDDEVVLESFCPEALEDNDVKRLANRVTLVRDDECEAAFPEQWGATVEVELEDGSCLIGRRSVPRGDYRDSLDDDEFRSHLHTLLDWGLGSKKADDALQAVLNMRSRDMRAVTASLHSNQ